jgi:cytochrome c oxidase subunit 3
MNTHEHAVSHVHRDDIGSRMGMWLFLFTELLLFGGMFFLYAVYRYMNAEAFHVAAKELNTLIGCFNTEILLTSSLTMALYINDFFQLITILFALAFLVNKYFEWSAKFHHGIYPGGDVLLAKDSGEILFFGLYYVMTGLHGLHVIVGAALIGIMTRLTIKGIINKDSYVKLESAGLYWHLVDII